MPPLDPTKQISKKYVALPYDQNKKPMSGLVVPIVENDIVVGYVPINVTLDSTTGLATLVTTDIENLRLDRGVAFSSIIFRKASSAPEDVCLFKTTTKDSRFHKNDVYLNSGVITIWTIYLNPVISNNGTPLTATNRDTGNITVASATLFDSPTITSPGTLIGSFLISSNIRQFDLGPVLPLQLTAGDSLLIRRENGGGNSDVSVTIRWSEELN